MNSEELRHIGTVDAVDGEYAVVSFERSSMCAHCGICEGSGDSTQQVKIRVKNTLNAKEKDRVCVSVSNRSLLSASLIAYVVPLLLFLAGLFLGRLISEIVSIVAAICFCASSFFILRYFDRKNRENHTFEPKMISIEHED